MVIELPGQVVARSSLWDLVLYCFFFSDSFYFVFNIPSISDLTTCQLLGIFYPHLLSVYASGSQTVPLVLCNGLPRAPFVKPLCTLLKMNIIEYNSPMCIVL